MKLLVASHKLLSRDYASPSGYATDGGFPFQMGALAELFDETTIMAPVDPGSRRTGLIPLTGHHLTVLALRPPPGTDLRRKLHLLWWLPFSLGRMFRAVWSADAVHTPIPGDIGTIGMMLAWILRKPLFVRHGGNWFVQHSAAERFIKWFMERFAGGRNVMLATGGAATGPSRKNDAIRWIFSTTLNEETLRQIGRPRTLSVDTPLRLVTVGRLDRGKGIHRGISALKHLHEQGVPALYHIVGDGPERGSLERQIRDAGLEESVVLCGRLGQEMVLAELDWAHLFLFPTDSEGFPKAVLEALASGLPVISTPVSVLPHLIRDTCGILVPDPTPEVLASAIRDVINDTSLYAAMSAAALARVSEFTLERWRAEIGGLLRDAWGKRTRDDG